MYIYVFRHGEALYGQGEVLIGEADDLKEEGTGIIEKNAEKIAGRVRKEEKDGVIIYSSPFGRSLETARIISNILGANSIPGVIESIFALREADNFSWELFSPLINGGRVKFNSWTFSVNKQETNPLNLEPARYFFSGGINKIPASETKLWPKEFYDKVSGLESIWAITKRMIRFLKEMDIRVPFSRVPIISTHDSLIYFMSYIFTDGNSIGINCGEFVKLEKIDNRLFVREICGISAGNSSRDIVSAYNSWVVDNKI